MAIDLELDTITSGYNLSKINSNFNKIEEALVDGLSRSGTTPNHMNADIDMNGNDVLNVGSISLEGGETLEQLVERAETAATSAEASSDLAAVSAASLPNGSSTGVGNIPVWNGSGWEGAAPSSIGVVENISQLRSLSALTDFPIWLEGYYTKGDGGEGYWWQDSSDTTSSDDGGTVVVDTSGNRYKRYISGEMFPKWFGAKADAKFVTSSDITLASGGTALYVPGAGFSSEDVGKHIAVPGAGASSAALFTTIASVTDSEHVVLANAASTTIPQVSCTFTASISGTTMTVTAISGGALWYGDKVVSGATSCKISGLGTMSVVGYVGDWIIDTSQTVSSTTMTAVSPTTVTWGTDDTSAVQAAIDAATARGVYADLASGGYLTTSALVLTGGSRVRASEFGRDVNWDTGVSTSFQGGWVFACHTGNVFTHSGEGGGLLGLGIVRAQAAYRVGWAPGVFSADLYSTTAMDMSVENVTFLNSTSSAVCYNGGRWNFINVRGQPLSIGLSFDLCHDVSRINRIHFWAFWSKHPGVYAYTRSNAVALNTARCDGPQIDDFFVIHYNKGWRVQQGGYGTTTLATVGKLYLDSCVTGVEVNSDVTAFTAFIGNLVHYGDLNSSSRAVYVHGASCKMSVGNLETFRVGAEAVRVDTGTDNTVQIGNVVVNLWDQDAAGNNCFYASAGNTVKIANRPVTGTAGGSGEVCGGAGIIDVDVWRSWTPTVSSQSGAYTAVTLGSCKYKVKGNEVHYRGTITLTTIGTGGGAMTVSPPALPYGAVTFPAYAIGVGRNMTSTGYLLSVTASTGGTLLGVSTYGNAAPATVDGSVIVISGTYPLSVT